MKNNSDDSLYSTIWLCDNTVIIYLVSRNQEIMNTVESCPTVSSVIFADKFLKVWERQWSQQSSSTIDGGAFTCHTHTEPPVQGRGMEGQTESKGGRACFPSICKDWLIKVCQHREVKKHLMLHSCSRHWIWSLRRELGCSFYIIFSSLFPEK